MAKGSDSFSDGNDIEKGGAKWCIAYQIRPTTTPDAIFVSSPVSVARTTV